MHRRTIGILGGMGPLATVEFYRRVVTRTPARSDQDHLHVVIDADPTIPDRTAALVERGADPTPRLIAAARRLEASGADFLVVPCHTAHTFLPAVQAAIGIPIVDMIGEAALELARRYPPDTPFGLLATRGTIAAGLYERALSRQRLRVLVPDEAGQCLVDRVITRIKQGCLDEETTALVSLTVERMAKGEVAAIVIGCTELSLILLEERSDSPLVDTTSLLADVAVAIGLGIRPLPPPLPTPGSAAP
ncbi:amino acid racemase [Thermomicrobium sp. 4228-Ro]|uniref:aspartate/glutamate racemase family protein n=1 Tax=Thermomicrobium sp. 4228-Ro TaxID=2993937 RepID=UPI0022494A60|nr:amino acid racemase [Thermomicrobium sp. 4228-Ro]MCX2727629.1 amino acid racemase [Thermomicrobium sp. 4228-Ro]